MTGEQRVYSVVVKSNLTATLRKIRKDLENLTELDIFINEDRIVITGTVSNPDHWSHLQRVLPLYSKDCVSFATFAISADTVLDLKKRLQNAGFVFAGNNEPPKTGELTMTSTSDTVYISGELYSKSSIQKIEPTLKAAPIMSSNLIKLENQVTLAKPMLNVMVAFVTVSDTDNFNRTGNINPVGTFDASFLRRWLDGAERAKTIAFGTSMDGTLSLLQSNLVSKVQEKGSVQFPNGGNGDYKFGGTIKVPVSGTDNGDLKDVTYGNTINISGELISRDAVDLQLSITQQDVTTDAQGNYDQKENSVKMPFTLDLDKTYIVAHHKKKSEMDSDTGTPFLMRLPIIKYFFSDEGHREEETDVMILVSASIMENTTIDKIEMNTEGALIKSGKDTKELIQTPIMDGLSKDAENVFH